MTDMPPTMPMMVPLADARAQMAMTMSVILPSVVSGSTSVRDWASRRAWR